MKSDAARQGRDRMKSPGLHIRITMFDVIQGGGKGRRREGWGEMGEKPRHASAGIARQTNHSLESRV